MQAVILAAGEGKRMRPLTLERPKPLIEVAGRPVLEYIIDAMPQEVGEVILVVGYKADMIRAHFGESYGGRRITYADQPTPTGTAHALALAKPFLTGGRFIFSYGDDIHGAEAIRKALAYPLAILATEHPEPSKFGVISLNADGTLADIVEKPEVPPTNLISAGVMVLDQRIFDYETVRHENGEYYLTHPLGLFAKEHPFMVVEQDFWIPMGYPGDILLAEERLFPREAEVRPAAPRGIYEAND